MKCEKVKNHCRQAKACIIKDVHANKSSVNLMVNIIKINITQYNWWKENEMRNYIGRDEGISLRWVDSDKIRAL